MLGRWADVVGPDIASHAEPTGLRDGVLSVSAESTAWATQLRMVQAQLLAKIAGAVGDGQGAAAEGGQGGEAGLGQPAGVGDPEQHAGRGLGL